MGGIAAIHYLDPLSQKTADTTSVVAFVDNAFILDFSDCNLDVKLEQLYHLHNFTWVSKDTWKPIFYLGYKINSIVSPMFFVQSSLDHSFQTLNSCNIGNLRSEYRYGIEFTLVFTATIMNNKDGYILRQSDSGCTSLSEPYGENLISPISAFELWYYRKAIVHYL